MKRSGNPQNRAIVLNVPMSINGAERCMGCVPRQGLAHAAKGQRRLKASEALTEHRPLKISKQSK
jgi:hypothetical protein